MGANVLNLGCGVLFAAPLTETESEAFTRDLGAVLAKHNVSDFRYAEEFNLLATTVGIVAPRAIAKLSELADDDEGQETESGDGGARANGVGKVDPDAQVSFAGFGGAKGEAATILGA